MGIFDRFRRRHEPAEPEPQPVWQVRLDGSEVVADDGRGKSYRCSIGGVRWVRVVPLMVGGHHGAAGQWQVALRRDDGDVLVGPAHTDWRPARALAEQLCAATQLPLDELTERLFSQVGSFTRKS